MNPQQPIKYKCIRVDQIVVEPILGLSLFAVLILALILALIEERVVKFHFNDKIVILDPRKVLDAVSIDQKL